MSVVRYISQFAKGDEPSHTRIEFVEEPSLLFLQQLVGAPADDLIYEEVELNEVQLRQLAPFIGREADVTKYDYFLSCCRSE